ncbi:MAG: hypothetical protein PF439_07785 [Helicobacteraceae bacterium]|jgi:AraC-like DNA-binding protein|nr:hypothetical protein [Helicobacteraceae bacterium]
MDIEKFERDIRSFYKKHKAASLDKKVLSLAEHIEKEWHIAKEELKFKELKTIAESILEIETQSLHDEVQDLLAQKEQIERQLERKALELQNAKYAVFNTIEEDIAANLPSVQRDLHQIKLQSIDLFDMLEEMVESAVLTTLEKGHDVEETIKEITKDITYETLNEGAMGTVRIRKIISTILKSAIGVAEATPNSAEEILRGSLKGIRAGLIHAIREFKKQLQYAPEELKANVLADYGDLDELKQTNLVFTQTIQSLSHSTDKSTEALLIKISKDIHLDMDELILISKETVELMKNRFNFATKDAFVRGSRALNSDTAKEAKRMGIQAFDAAKTALDSAIKTAKDKIEKK